MMCIRSLLLPWLWQAGFIKDGSQLSIEQKTKHKHENKKRPAICCKVCQHVITRPESAIELQGSHHHVFANPHGQEFEIGLYNQADVRGYGEHINEFSWFVGYSWRIVLCQACGEHLGWFYQNEHNHSFYGLIVMRLSFENEL